MRPSCPVSAQRDRPTLQRDLPQPRRAEAGGVSGPPAFWPSADLWGGQRVALRIQRDVHHIANTHGDTLLPADTAVRVRAVEWMFAARNTTEPPIIDHAIAALFEREEPWSAPCLLSILDGIDERTDPRRSCAIRTEGHMDTRVIRSSVQTARLSESRCLAARSASPNRCM